MTITALSSSTSLVEGRRHEPTSKAKLLRDLTTEARNIQQTYQRKRTQIINDDELHT